MPPRPGDVDATIDHIFATVRRIAVVGLSQRPTRASHEVAAALQRRGWEIIPVNPTVDEVLGVPGVDSLVDIEGHVDLVDVFRREELLPGIAKQAVVIGADALWNQLGLASPEAAGIAAEAGIAYVEDRCIKVEAMRRDAHPPPVDES